MYKPSSNYKKPSSLLWSNEWEIHISYISAVWTQFREKAPCNPKELVHFRLRIGEEGVAPKLA